MSQRQQLTARISVLDADELATDAEVLASEHVLVQDGRRYAFFHESFFDYAFARLWLDLDQSLVEFLLADEQELSAGLRSGRSCSTSETTTQSASSVRPKPSWLTPRSGSTSRPSSSRPAVAGRPRRRVADDPAPHAANRTGR